MNPSLVLVLHFHTIPLKPVLVGNAGLSIMGNKHPNIVADSPQSLRGAKLGPHISAKMCGTAMLDRSFEKGKITTGWSDRRAAAGWATEVRF